MTVRRFVVSAPGAAIHLAVLGLVPEPFKVGLLGRFRTGEDSTRALLRRHGMTLPQTPDFGEQARLDPGFEQRVLDAYEQRWLRIDAVADLLQVSHERTRVILAMNDLSVFEDEVLVDAGLAGLVES